MSDDMSDEIVQEFLGESDHYLQTLNDCLLKAEDLLKEGQTVEDDDINLMFRAAHTIKGTSSFLDLNNVSHLTHEMETILDRVRNHEMVLTVEIIDVLFGAFDALNGLLDNLRDNGTDEGDTSEILEKIRVVLTGGSAPAEDATSDSDGGSGSETAGEASAEPEAVPEAPPEPAPPAAPAPVAQEMSEEDLKYLNIFLEEAEGSFERMNQILINMEGGQFNADEINEIFRIAHTIKGSAGIINRSDIESLAHNMENLLSQCRENSTPLSEDAVSVLFDGVDLLKEIATAMMSGDYQQRDVSALVQRLEALKGGGAPAAAPSAVPVAAPVSAGGMASRVSIAEMSDEAFQKLSTDVRAEKNIFSFTISINAASKTKSMRAVVLQERIGKIATLYGATINADEIDDNATTDIQIQYLCGGDLKENELRESVVVDEVDFLSIEQKSKDQLVSEIGTRVARTFVPGAESQEGEGIPMAATEPSDQTPDKKEAPAAAQPAAAAAQPAVAPAVKKPAQEAGSADKAKEKAAPVEVTTMRIDARKLDNLMNLAGELVITRARFAQNVSDLVEQVGKTRNVSDNVREISDSINKTLLQLAGSEEEFSVADVTKRLNEVQGRVDSLKSSLILKAIEAKAYGLDEDTGALSKLSSDIQNAVMQTRMVQIEGVFTRFKRLVRDISKQVEKSVTLEIYGEDTELDKKIVDELGDPLTHMVRNAIDHGLETPEERKTMGKPETGTVRLGASHKGNNIVIEIADDGKGLDPDRIAQKAFEKGIINEEQLESMPEKEKHHLIFAPGFSTAAQVTGLSGRGVGMDVVKRMIESLNGTIDIVTKLGEGSSFLMSIPLTLAIIQALIVCIGDQVYAIPLEAVSEIIKVSSDDIYSIEGNATIKLRDRALSLITLKEAIQVEEEDREGQKHQQVVVLTDGDESIGVTVDSLIGEDEIVIKSLPNHFKNVVGISGASILGNGKISLILDVAAIIRATQ